MTMKTSQATPKVSHAWSLERQNERLIVTVLSVLVASIFGKLVRFGEVKREKSFFAGMNECGRVPRAFFHVT